MIALGTVALQEPLLAAHSHRGGYARSAPSERSSPNYGGEFRQRIWPLFLCGFVVAVHITCCQLTDGTTEEQRHRVFYGSSLNYVGELRLGIWPLFLCASVVGSEHSGSPQKAQKT